jgi:ribonuclease HI
MIEDPVSIARRAVCLLEEWRNIPEPKPARSPTPHEHWLAPEAGWMKINTDGAMLKNSDKGGGGVVACDHDGRFLAGSCHFFLSLLDPEDAELRACKAGIELARRMQVQQVILEIDSASVVAKLGSKAGDRSMHGPLVEEIKKGLWLLANYQVKWARCTANGVAHSLAKEGCSLESDRVWFMVPPVCINSVLFQDMVK